MGLSWWCALLITRINCQKGCWLVCHMGGLPWWRPTLPLMTPHVSSPMTCRYSSPLTNQIAHYRSSRPYFNPAERVEISHLHWQALATVELQNFTPPFFSITYFSFTFQVRIIFGRGNETSCEIISGHLQCSRKSIVSEIGNLSWTEEPKASVLPLPVCKLSDLSYYIRTKHTLVFHATNDVKV